MRDRPVSFWQASFVIVGLAIVATAVIAPRVHDRVSMVASKGNGIVASNNPGLQTTATSDQGASASAPAPATGTGGDPAPPAVAAPRGTFGGGASGTATGRAQTQTDRTLFSDTFANDPLGRTLPTGWRLEDTLPTGGTSILGGLPIVGSLLSGGGSSTSDLLPSVLNDGSHVLGRVTGTWSLLSAGSAWTDYSVSSDVKMTSPGSGFVGVAGRLQDSSNFLSCGIGDGDMLQLVQVVNGQRHLLASRPLGVVSNAFHKIRMDMQGSSLTCSMDGTMVLHGVAGSTSGGRLGLVDLGSLSGEFGNVSATSLP